jgi:hypothetical protein
MTHHLFYHSQLGATHFFTDSSKVLSSLLHHVWSVIKRMMIMQTKRILAYKGTVFFK